MRLPLVAVLAVQLSTLAAAHAGRTGGSDGGGRLGQVASGISTATSADDNAPGGAGGPDTHTSNDGELYERRERGDLIVVIDRDGTIVRSYPKPGNGTGGTATVDGFVGVQKVYESEGSLSAALSFEDRWLRLAGSVTRYWETEPDQRRLTLTVPSLTAGVRVDDRGPTRAFLEGGVAIARTQYDGMTAASLTGPTLGVHVEHTVRGTALVADAHAMFFESSVRAYAARLAVRVHHLELAFRVLDFNVGPALYGPEAGFAF